MCELNVDTDPAMLCWSPTSAYTPSNIGNTLPSSAGTYNPDWCISTSSPTVFIETVFPPVFGPVMTSTDDSAPMPTDTGTASSPISGCRAFTSCTTGESSGASPTPTATPFSRALYRARAMMKSSRAVSRIPTLMSSATAPTSSERSISTLRVSSSSSSASSRHVLQASTVANGSTNNVASVFDTSCTMPGTLCLNSVLTWSTRRSDRTEITWSCSASSPTGDRITRSSASTALRYAARTLRRNVPSVGVALSSTSPRMPIFALTCRCTSSKSGMPDAIPASTGALAVLREKAVRARPSTSSESATSSNSFPVSTPPRLALSTASVASTLALRSGSPDSSR